MKKFSVCLVVLLSLFIMACGGKKETVGGDKVKIALLAHTFTDQFGAYLYGAIEDAATNYADLELTVFDAKDDAGVQLSQVENAITSGHDAIIVYTIDRPSFGMLAKTARDAGLLVTAVNRYPETQHEDLMDLYVGIEERQAGILIAEKFLSDLEKEGRLNEEMEAGILLGILGADNTLKRTAGFTETIAKYPNIKVTREGTEKWERGLGITLVENWLQADVDSKLKVIFGNNDEMAIGGILAAKQIGRDDIKFYGVDAIPAAVDMIGEGLRQQYNKIL